MKLAIITTHPIQYNAPLFALLAERSKVEIMVFYTWGKDVLNNKYDPGFGKIIEWDIPLLQGYPYCFVENTAKEKGSHHFRGIINPWLIEAIESWGANAVLVYGWSFVSHLKTMRYFKGKIPVLFRGDSTFINQDKKIKNIFRSFLLKKVYKYIDTALYVGTINKQYYVKAGLSKSQLKFAPHAIDNLRFKKESEKNILESNNLRAQFGINSNNNLFLYAGKLDANKNVHLLIKEFCKADNIKSHLLIVGNGTEEEKLKNSAKGLSNIHFLPFQNQNFMPVLYGACDVFVLPSIAETWGLALNEAMACNKAVVASKGCAASYDLISEGKNGYTFNTNNPDELHHIMQNLNQMSREALIEMGKKSGEIIEDWSFENICQSIEEALLKR